MQKNLQNNNTLKKGASKMTKEEYLKALDTIYTIYHNGELDYIDNVDKDGAFTQKELDQARELLGAMWDDAKNQLKKAYKKEG